MNIRSFLAMSSNEFVAVLEIAQMTPEGFHGIGFPLGAYDDTTSLPAAGYGSGG
jgi:hypothetical protein